MKHCRFIVALYISCQFAFLPAVYAELIDPPEQPWFPKAPPLSAPKGEVIKVSSVDELFAAAERIQPGGTILIEDGHYFMPRYFEIAKDNVTLRGASGRRENVVLDGAKSDHGELVGLRHCSGVTIADLTIQNIKWNGFKINSDSNVQKVTIRNCIIHNIWQRGVKGVKVPLDKLEEFRPKDCVVEYCLFYNDHAKRFSDDPADVPKTFNGNYIGGIDIMYAKNWIIRHNVFIGIQGRTREGRGCVFLWHEGEDCLIDGNIILNCDVGIALGNSSGISAGESRVHCSRFIVRNNFITNTSESGILADYTEDCRIVNNTIHDPSSSLQRLIRIVHNNDGLFAANNVLSGPEMRIESSSRIVLKNNLAKILTPYFADPQNGDLHWKTKSPDVVDKAESLPDVPTDIDGEPRGEKPDLGADEFAETSAVSNGE